MLRGAVHSVGVRWAGALAALAACTVGRVDLRERRCPCAPGWECDQARNVCVESVDAGGGTVRASRLGAVWSTPNTIRWSWEPDPGAGAADRLARYEIAVARTERELGVEPYPPQVVVFTPAQNPELGRYYLPRQNGREPVRESTTDGLEPETQYFARLTAVDTFGGRAVTNVASFRTGPRPAGGVALFTAGFAGYTLPSDPAVFRVGTAGCATAGGTCAVMNVRVGPASDSGAGRACVAPGAAPPAAGATCWENARLNPTPAAALPIGPGQFETAYLEFALATTAHVFYTETRVWVGADGALPEPHKFASITPRPDGMWRTFQIPLRAHALAGVQLTYEALMAQRLLVREVGIGAPWDDGAEVRIGEVHVRW